MTTSGAGRCRSCGAEILWIVTPAGRRMPLDTREVTLYTAAGEPMRGHPSHFASCVDAAFWRRPDAADVAADDAVADAQLARLEAEARERDTRPPGGFAAGGGRA